jgi:hypothetical protein
MEKPTRHPDDDILQLLIGYEQRVGDMGQEVVKNVYRRGR